MLRKIRQRTDSLSGFYLLFLVVLVNIVTYSGTRLFTTGMKHYSLYSAVDEVIPFCSFFVLFYVLAFLQWIIGFLMIARDEREVRNRYLMGEILAKLLCLCCFVLLPTTIARPEITGGGIWNELTALIYRIDAADNLFPSIHCLESYVCLRSAFALKRVSHKKWYIIGNAVMSVLVFASTVMIKQHVFVDIIGAFLVVELGMSGVDALIRWRQGGRNDEKQKTVGRSVPGHRRA